MSTALRAMAAIAAFVGLGLAPTAMDRAPHSPPADHHMHVWSADARDLLIRAQRAVGQEVIAEEEIRPLTAADALAQLDSAGIQRGVLLSNAYFFGIPDVEVANELPG